MDRCEIILDTNIALHFAPIEQIDWAEVSKCKRPTIVITPILLEELERQKIFNPSAALRRRAQRSIDDIERLMGIDDPVEIRTGVTLHFLSHEPTLDYKAHRLDRDVQDDRFIAAALERHSLGHIPVFIASNDSGMALKLRSRAIDILKLPAALRLPEEEDALQKELKQARLELEKLRNRQPRLTVRFSDRTRKQEVVTPSAVDPDVPSLADMRAQHRPIPAAGARFGTGPATRAPGPQLMPGFTATDRAKKHNENLEVYFGKYASYLEKLDVWSEMVRLSSVIELELFNDGSGTATDVDIVLSFPANVGVLHSSDFPARPEPPIPPSSIYRHRVGSVIDRNFLHMRSHFSVNDGDAGIEEDEPGVVRFSARSLKPKCVLRLQDFLLLQLEPLDGKGIEIDVSITLHDGEPVHEKLAFTFETGEPVRLKEDKDEPE